MQNPISILIMVLSFIIIAVSASKDNLAQIEQGQVLGPHSAAEKLADSVYGLAYKDKHRPPAIDYQRILVSNEDFKLYNDYQVYNLLPRIDFFYNVNYVIPFSLFGLKMSAYMSRALVAIRDVKTDRKIFSYLMHILLDLKKVMSTVVPVSIEKDNTHYLGYEYKWEYMESLKKSVGSLYGSEIIITQFSESTSLKDSFVVLKDLFHYLHNSITVQWKVKFVEETKYKLSKNDGLMKIKPTEVTHTMSTLLDIVYNYADYQVTINEAHFYEKIVEACEGMLDLVLETRDVAYAVQTKEFLDSFKEFHQAAHMNYRAESSEMRVVIFDANTKLAFEIQLLNTLTFIDGVKGLSKKSNDTARKLKGSLEALKQSLEQLVPNELDETYRDFVFAQTNRRYLVKNQDIDLVSWRGLKEIHRELSSRSSVFDLNEGSDISSSLRRFFESSLMIFEQYEQSRKLQTSFIYLYQVTKEFLVETIPQVRKTSQLTVEGTYKYPRVICFALQDHLSKFSALMIELLTINKRDSSDHERFALAIESIDKILNTFGRTVAVTSDYCLENFRIVHSQEVNQPKVIVQPVEDLRSSHDATSITDSESSELVQSDKISEIDTSREDLEPANHNSVTNRSGEDTPIAQNDDDISIAPIKVRTGKRIRKIVIVEIIDCTKCLDDTDLRSFVQSLGIQKSHI